jgi:Kef-type K+ transport system membrane component KefB
LSSEVVIEMKMFNTLALGLIATGAGLELDVSRLRKVWKTLIATIGVKTVLSASLVIATTIGIQTATGALVLPAEGQLVSLALVLGVFSLTTSPAIVMAVLDETKAKGRMTDLALGAAVLKDLVVIVSLATVVAISRTLLVPGSELEVSTLVNVGKEIVSSVAAGAVLGVLLILYIRYVHAEMLLFVAAMILVVSELGMSLHLEILLVFITAGFVVRNFSRHEEELASPLSLVSLPVFVLFFTNAGASVDLRTTLRILPLALGICVVRAFAFWVSARVGGIVGREEPAVKNNAWLGYLPQAGVTLGLVGLAAQQLPELAGPIASTGMAMVAINLLIGPITLRQALRLTGDIEGGVPSISETVPQSKRPSAVPEVLLDEVKARADDAISNAKSAIEAMESEVLRALVQGTQEQLSKAADEFFEESLKPWSESFRASLSKALASSAKDDGFSNWLVAFPPPDTAHQGQECRGFCERLHTVIPPLPEHISASM